MKSTNGSLTYNWFCLINQLAQCGQTMVVKSCSVQTIGRTEQHPAKILLNFDPFRTKSIGLDRNPGFRWIRSFFIIILKMREGASCQLRKPKPPVAGGVSKRKREAAYNIPGSQDSNCHSSSPSSTLFLPILSLSFCLFSFRLLLHCFVRAFFFVFSVFFFLKKIYILLFLFFFFWCLAFFTYLLLFYMLPIFSLNCSK